MPKFTGQLNSNEIFAALFNMIISQQVFADNIKDTKSTLVGMARVDGSMYGDQKLYYSTDVLKSTPWGADAEAENLLKLNRPKAPECQAIVLNVFRQISLTVDNYLSKRAWSTEGAFTEFNSVMLGWMRETKKVYDSTTYNTYIGTTKSDKGRENLTIDVTTAVGETTGEQKARIEAQTIAQFIADLIVKLEDISRDYNDYGHLRSYLISDLAFVWNSEAVSKIEKRDLPTIFHKEILDKFAEHTLPARYFGNVNAVSVTKATANTRSLIEQDITFKGGETIKAPTSVIRAGKEIILDVGATINAGDIGHVFAGDSIPTNTELVVGGNITVPSYDTDSSILFKVYHTGPNSVPYMSAFEVGTSFFNPKSLTENHYLTFGHNTLEYLKNYPFITVKQA